MQEEGSRGTLLEESLRGFPPYEDALHAVETAAGSKQLKKALDLLTYYRLDRRGVSVLLMLLERSEDKEVLRRIFHILGQIDCSTMETQSLSESGHALGRVALVSPQHMIQSLLALSSITLFWPRMATYLKPVAGQVLSRKDNLEDLSAKTGFFASKGNVNLKMLTHALALASVSNGLLDCPDVRIDMPALVDHVLSAVQCRDILSARFAVRALGTVLEKLDVEEAVRMLMDRRRNLGPYLYKCIENFFNMSEKDRKKKKNANPFMEDTMARVDLIRLCSIVCFNLPSPSSLVNQFLPILQLLTKDQDARVFSAAVNALCHDRADPRLLWEKTRLLGDNVLNYVHVRLASWDRQSAQMFHHKICRTCVTIASHCIQKSGPMDINPAVAKDHALSQEPQHQPATIQPDGSFMGAADISSAPAPTSAEVPASAGDFFDELFAQGEFIPDASPTESVAGSSRSSGSFPATSSSQVERSRSVDVSGTVLAARLGEELYSSLFLLKSVTKKFLDSPDIHVRLQALQVQCWLAETRELFQLVQGRMAKEVPSTAGWKACHVDAILLVLRDRACCQLDILPFLLEAIVICHARASPQCIVDCLSTFLQVDQGRPVLQTIFHILDQPRFDQEGSIASIDYTAITEALYWFLGEYANILASTSQDEEPPNAATLSTQDRLMQQSVMAGYATKNMEEHPSKLLDVSNACLKSILLRLEQASTFSPQEIRCTCVQALAKIGLRSQDPVRLHVYEILLLLSNDSFLGLSAYTLPVLRLLDDIYSFQSRLLATEFRNSGGLSHSDLQAFAEEHELLRERVSFFASISQDFSVLGSASRQLLTLS